MALTPSRLLALLVVAAVMSAISLSPAQACLWMGGWLDPDKPFDAAYFAQGQTIFRGRPVGIHSPKLGTETSDRSGSEVDFENSSEVTFEVSATFRGEVRETWTAYRIGSIFSGQLDLETFKKEVGDDLLVVLSEPDDFSKQFTELPLVAVGVCGELAMRRFPVMEPVLRRHGLID